MKEPKTFSNQESLLNPFVIAAGTNRLQSACELLFIHGNDLTWGPDGLGLFLVNVDTDDHFDEAVQVAEARSKLIFSSAAAAFLRAFQPQVISMAAGVARELTNKTERKEKERIIGNAVASEFANEKTRNKLAQIAPEAFGLDQWMNLADAIATSLLSNAVVLRQRQLASTGKSEDGYQRMLYALQRLDVLDRIARVAYPQDTLNLEISVASQGDFRATAAVDGSNTVEWLRLKSDFASLKRGQDKALPLFIAAYINGHHTGSREAFASAQYGGPNSAEIDVVIPALALGFEVKLYQSPFAQTENKLVGLAKQLKRQLRSYAEAGCAQTYYICNLSQELADRVLQIAQEGTNVGIEVAAIGGGPGSLLPVLDSIRQQLELVQQARFEQMVQKRVTPASRKTRKR